MRMKMNELSGNFTIDSPSAGKLKWHATGLTGSSLELRDASGMKLAQLRSGGFPGSGERKLEVYVPCHQAFLELIVLSGFAAKSLSSSVNDVVGEVIGGVAGA